MTAAIDTGSSSSIDAAVEADHAACVARFGDMPNAELHRDGREQELLTGLESGFFNNVIGVRWEGPDIDRLAPIVERAKARGVPWRFYVTAATKPVDLDRALVARGLIQGIPGHSMVLDDAAALARSEVADLKIEPVVDDDGLDRWLSVRIETNGWDGDTAGAWRLAHRHIGFGDDAAMHYWTGSVHDVAVANVLMHLGDERSDGTRDAGLYHVETVPDARRRGIASALTTHAVAAAVSAGATRIVLSATDAAVSAYARLGFRRGGSFTFWYDPELGY